MAQDTTGTGAIAGRVTTAGAPVPLVTVCVVDSIRCVISGEDGGFRIGDVRAGDYRLEITPPGLPPQVTMPIDVHAGLTRQVDIDLPRVDAVTESVVVTGASLEAPIEAKTSAFLISAATVFRSAGALQDVSRYVQSLPGVVVGSSDFRNDIIVRGGSPLENLFIVDNVEVPNINSFANFASAGGTVSLLDSSVIRDVTFLTGGYPASYVNRASSVLQVAQREGDRERVRGRATVGFAGSGGVLEGPLRDGRGSWIVSARRSFLDFFTDDIGFGGVPVLYSINAKAVLDAGERDRLWVVNLSGIDRIRLGRTADSEPDEEVFNLDIRYRGRRSATGFNWQHVYDKGVALLGVTHSYASVGSTVKDLVRTGVPPQGIDVDELIANSPTVYFEDSREDETTFKYDFSRTINRVGSLQTGATYKVFRLRYRVDSPFGADSPYFPKGDANPIALRLGDTTPQTGAYAQVTSTPARRLETTVGIRADRFSYLDRTTLSPRVSARLTLSAKLAATGAFGTYAQQPPFLFVAAFPSNRTLRPLRATHWVSGLSYSPVAGARLGVEVYRKIYSDYPVSRDVPSLSLANIGDTFNVREVLFPLESRGRGVAYGVEFSAERLDTGTWWGQGNLAFARARHAGADGVLRNGSFDYPVVLNLTAGRRLGARWEVAGRATVLGGRPYTPFDAVLSGAQRRGVYDLARINAVRAPAYGRIDVRVDRRIAYARSELLLFVGIQNVTNRRNFGGTTWNRQANSEEANEQLGIFPLVGLEWRF
ncbi:MAG: TonB-dependent receptor [Vicinamibacterales bacterium]